VYRFRIISYLLIVLIVGACSESDGDSQKDAGGPDDVDNGKDAGSAPVSWKVEMVEDSDVGLQASLATGPDGMPAVAYFASESFSDGVCEEVEVNPPARTRQLLRFAVKTGSGWDVETVEEPVVVVGPTGVDLAFDTDGNPALAFTGGEPEMQFCGANDAVFGVRENGQWSFDTASSMSGDSATGDEASDAGFIVGLWPALAFDPDGNPAVVHKDMHFGMQHDDKYRADAEFAWRSGSAWTNEAVDYGEAAGDHSDLVFDSDGRPVASYAITVEAQGESRHGVWASRREETGEWIRVKLHRGAIHQETSVAVNPVTGAVSVAFYSASDMAVRIRTLSDPEKFEQADAWSDEVVGDSRYDEGRHVSLAFTPSGESALAYHRCRLITSSSSGCDQNDEAAIFALKKAGAWQRETIRKASRGSCGEYTSLAFSTDGTAYVAYRCTVETDEGFEFRLYVADRKVGR